MVTAVKRWITYEVGDGSSVGAVVFRLGCYDLEEKKKGAFDALLTNDFPKKMNINVIVIFLGPSSLLQTPSVACFMLFPLRVHLISKSLNFIDCSKV